MNEGRINSILDHLKDAGVVAILRGQNPKRMIQRGIELANMGCTAIEVTLDSSQALEVIASLRKQLPDSVLIGVGTLLDVDQSKNCFDAGAEFALSPTHPDRMIENCHSSNMLAVPGVSNLQELEVAIENGAKIAKLFPATDWKIEQLTSVSLPLIPVGGIDNENMWDWLDAGAWCVGMGSNLCGSDLSDDEHESTTWFDSEQQTARDIFMELQRRRNVA
jgi:Entner-Doudoroff aldolase